MEAKDDGAPTTACAGSKDGGESKGGGGGGGGAKEKHPPFVESLLSVKELLHTLPISEMLPDHFRTPPGWSEEQVEGSRRRKSRWVQRDADGLELRGFDRRQEPTACILHAHYMFNVCILHCMLTACIPNPYWYCMHAACTPHAHAVVMHVDRSSRPRSRPTRPRRAACGWASWWVPRGRYLPMRRLSHSRRPAAYRLSLSLSLPT